MPIISFSQKDNSYKNGIGFHFTQNDRAGSGASFRFTRKIFDQDIIKVEFRIDPSGAFAARLGYEFLRLNVNRFEVGTGIDLKFQREEIKAFNQTGSVLNRDLYNEEVALEVPLELRFSLSPRIRIQAGISFAYRVRSSWGIPSSSTYLSELRLGVGYKF